MSYHSSAGEHTDVECKLYRPDLRAKGKIKKGSVQTKRMTRGVIHHSGSPSTSPVLDPPQEIIKKDTESGMDLETV